MTRFSIRFLLSSRAKYSARKKAPAILLARKCVRAEAIPVAAHATSNTFGGLRDRNGNLPASQRGIGKWFDTSCFATPRAGTFGNSGAFVLEGPSAGVVSSLVAGSASRLIDLRGRIDF